MSTQDVDTDISTIVWKKLKPLTYVLILFVMASQSNAIYSGLLHISSFLKTESDLATKPTSSATYEWKLHGIKDGVATYMANIPGTKLIGARGVTVLDVHISDAMAPFVNMTMAYDWVDLLKNITPYPALDPPSSVSSLKDKLMNPRKKDTKKDAQKDCIENNNLMLVQDGYVPVDIVHQETRLPWPISPRDIVLRREFYYNHTERSSSDSNKNNQNQKKQQPMQGFWKKKVSNSDQESNVETVEKESNVDTKEGSGTADKVSTVTVTYHSVEDARIPPQKGYIRADTPHVLWRYTSVPPGVNICDVLSKALLVKSSSSSSKSSSSSDSSSSSSTNTPQLLLDSLKKTYKKSSNACILPPTTTNLPLPIGATKKHTHHRTVVEIECVFDAKGSIPTWFINFMQQSWPHKTLGKYRKLSETGRALPFQKVRDW